MSGDMVSRALEARFAEVRRTELERLQRKLGRLSDEDRKSAEAIVTDVIAALAHLPEERLGDPVSLAAIVHLFNLGPDCFVEHAP